MINILSYVGMNMHSEVCLWTLLGLVRTIFDATLFKVNANLKQVWQMSMPDELSMPVQQMLRTMISGVMLVQCFTVYVYLASYIVLLYPVFLEERPTLVLPWLLLAATRKLLCELTSLALGLGTCVLLGPARPPCIKFVIVKLVSIMPAFYMWMLIFEYYHVLKVTTAFKTFTAVLPPNEHDYGLELAIRRRRTKSLLGEDQLRTKIVAGLYGERPSVNGDLLTKSHPNIVLSSRLSSSPHASIEQIKTNADLMTPTSVISNRISESGSYEDWYGSDVVMPRDADRILEQFVLMMLRIGSYLKKEGTSLGFEMFTRKSSHTVLRPDSHNCTTMPSDDTDTPHFVGSSKENTASYVREYPQIFMKRNSDLPRSSESKIAAVKTVHCRVENDENGNVIRSRKRTVNISPNEKFYVKDIEKNLNKRVMSGNQHEQQSISTETNNQPNPTLNLLKSREINTDCNLSRINSHHKLDLDNILSSSDSLKSIVENFNRITENNKINEENDNGTASANRNKEKNI